MYYRKNKPAFTLIEMLVVITIIILAMALAVPAIRSLTGSRSQEAAQNVITTALGTARARAMAMQQVTGVMFYIDSGTDRVVCALVEQTPHEMTDSPNAVIYLDMVDGYDPINLPAGLRVYTMKDAIPYEFTTPPQYTEYFIGRYNGYNYPGGIAPNAGDPMIVNPVGGVILFDAMGRLTFRDYGFRFMYPPNPPQPARISAMGSVVYGANVALPPDWPTTANPPFLFSSAGFAIVDRETFLSATGAGGNFTDWNNPTNQADTDKWLDANASPIFVNRYDGTLLTNQ